MCSPLRSRVNGYGEKYCPPQITGHPLAGRLSRTISNRRKYIAIILSSNIHHLPSCRIKPRPFSRSAGCELNRASHPSGSSVLRYPATALAAVAAPEKRWCQAVSKGRTFVWLSRWRRQSAAGSRLGRFNHMHSVGGAKTASNHSSGCSPDRFLAHRLWPNR